MKNLKKQRRKYLFLIMFIYFIAVLLLFLRVDRLLYSDFKAHRSLNVIPLKTIFDYIMGNYTMYRAMGNLLINIIFFVPAGIYIEIFFFKMKRNIIWIVTFSATIEIIQYLLGTGVSDIDDIILNLLGGILGILFFRILVYLVKYKKAIQIISVLSYVCMFIMVVVLSVIMIPNI